MSSDGGRTGEGTTATVSVSVSASPAYPAGMAAGSPRPLHNLNVAVQRGLIRPPMSLAETIQRASQLRLSLKSELFDIGHPPDAVDDDAFIVRVSSCYAIRCPESKLRLPQSWSDAVRRDGRIHPLAEVFGFARWMLVDGKPGHKLSPGKAPDDRAVILCVAAAAGQIAHRDRLAGDPLLVANLRALKRTGASIRTIKPPADALTRTDIRDSWQVMYHERPEDDGLKSLIRSTRGLLHSYLNHLRAGGHGRGRLRSKRLEATLKALEAKTSRAAPSAPAAGRGSAALPAYPPVSSSLPTVTPLTRDPTLTLGYSSSARRSEYQGTTAAPLTRIRYRCTVAGKQQRLAGRVRFEPDLLLRENFEITALIDRMIVCFTTKSTATAIDIHNKLHLALALNLMVDDLGAGLKRISWPEPIDPGPRMTVHPAPGNHFALLLQDPTPQKLAEVMTFIDDRWGIDGPVPVFMLELSIDFRPQDGLPPVERLRLREHAVGLLHRHHHTTAVFASPLSDGRTVHQGASAPETNYLFSQPRGYARLSPDSALKIPEVRERVHHNTHERDIHLDATVYKGSEISGLQFSIQHKIADRRNTVAATKHILTEKDRRARMEVMVSGHARLCEDLGVCNVQDLAKLDFRRAQKKYLSLWLPTAKDDPHEKGETWLQFTSRGVYGVHHTQQLKLMEENERNGKVGKISGTREPRLRAGAGDNGFLVSWAEANNMIGKAVDKLQRSWSDFRFP